MAKQPTPFETWVIRNKNTGEFFVAPSGKNSWKAKGHAKNAWVSVSSSWSTLVKETLDKYGVEAIEDKTRHYEKFRFPRFDEQDAWELVELGGSVESLGKQLKEAVDLLTTIVAEELVSNRKIESVIVRFLESVK